MNRFAHLKATVEETPDPVAPAAKQATKRKPEVTPPPIEAPRPEETAPAEQTSHPTELEEVVSLVERRIGIVGKIPASVKDAYDEMVLRSRKYIGRPNADLAVQAWVELTLEDENFRRLWLKRIQDLKK